MRGPSRTSLLGRKRKAIVATPEAKIGDLLVKMKGTTKKFPGARARWWGIDWYPEGIIPPE